MTTNPLITIRGVRHCTGGIEMKRARTPGTSTRGTKRHQKNEKNETKFLETEVNDVRTLSM